MNERVEAYESLTLEEKEGGKEDNDLEGGRGGMGAEGSRAESVGWEGKDTEPKGTSWIYLALTLTIY